MICALKFFCTVIGAVLLCLWLIAVTTDELDFVLCIRPAGQCQVIFDNSREES